MRYGVAIEGFSHWNVVFGALGIAALVSLIPRRSADSELLQFSSLSRGTEDAWAINAFIGKTHAKKPLSTKKKEKIFLFVVFPVVGYVISHPCLQKCS